MVTLACAWPHSVARSDGAWGRCDAAATEAYGFLCYCIPHSFGVELNLERLLGDAPNCSDPEKLAECEAFERKRKKRFKPSALYSSLECRSCSGGSTKYVCRRCAPNIYPPPTRAESVHFASVIARPGELMSRAAREFRESAA